MFAKTKSTKQFVPVTNAEAIDFEKKFLDRLETCFGKEVRTAFTELEFLKIAAENGVTEMGQGYVTKARRHLSKFLGVK